MKTSNTLVLLILAIILAAYVYFFEMKGHEGPADEENVTLITNFEPASVQKLLLQSEEHGDIEFKRDSIHRFSIEKPIQARADNEQVENILKTLGSLNPTRTFSEEQDKNEELFGLIKPRLSVKIWLSDSPIPITLFWGKSNQVSYSVYLRKETDPNIYTVGEFAFTSLDSDVESYRERKLLPSRTSPITKISMNAPGMEITMKKEESRWMMTHPVNYLGDTEKVNDLIAATKDLRIETFEPVSEEEKAALESSPVLTISVWRDDPDVPDICFIGDINHKNEKRTALFNGDEQAVWVKGDAIEPFINTPESLLEHRSVLNYPFEYRKISISDGISSYSFGKGENNIWSPLDESFQGDSGAVSEKIEALIEGLTSMRAEKCYLNKDGLEPLMEKATWTIILNQDGENEENLSLYGQNPHDGLYVVQGKHSLPVQGLTKATHDPLIEEIRTLFYPSGSTRK